MKVGIIAPPWAAIPPVGYGGTEAVIDQLARGLSHAGHEVVLFTVGESTCPVHREFVLPTAEGARIGSCVPELRHVVAAYDAMVSAGVDIVHDHTMAGPVLASTPGFVDIPVVTTNHGPFNEELNELYQRVSQHVGVIAISHDQARRSRGVQIAAVIHHGIDPAAFPVGAGDGDYLFFLGRMDPAKGAHHAIHVARQTNQRLVIAAKMREASEHRYFETVIEPLLGDGIEFVGEVAGEHKMQLLGGAVALVSPIRWPEPFGMMMIESLACGTPVLSFREGAAPEIITHGVDGILADTDAELLLGADVVGRLDRHSCRSTVIERFTTERMVAAHLHVYRVQRERHRNASACSALSTLADVRAAHALASSVIGDAAHG